MRSNCSCVFLHECVRWCCISSGVDKVHRALRRRRAAPFGNSFSPPPKNLCLSLLFTCRNSQIAQFLNLNLFCIPDTPSLSLFSFPFRLNHSDNVLLNIHTLPQRFGSKGQVFPKWFRLKKKNRQAALPLFELVVVALIRVAFGDGVGVSGRRLPLDAAY